jgi:hypothetical protein
VRRLPSLNCLCRKSPQQSLPSASSAILRIALPCRLRRMFLWRVTLNQIRAGLDEPTCRYLTHIQECRALAQYHPHHLMRRNLDLYDIEPVSPRGHLWEEPSRLRRASAWCLAVEITKQKIRFYFWLWDYRWALRKLTSKRCIADIACEMWRSWVTQYKISCA